MADGCARGPRLAQAKSYRSFPPTRWAFSYRRFPIGAGRPCVYTVRLCYLPIHVGVWIGLKSDVRRWDPYREFMTDDREDASSERPMHMGALYKGGKFCSVQQAIWRCGST